MTLDGPRGHIKYPFSYLLIFKFKHRNLIWCSLNLTAPNLYQAFCSTLIIATFFTYFYYMIAPTYWSIPSSLGFVSRSRVVFRFVNCRWSRHGFAVQKSSRKSRPPTSNGKTKKGNTISHKLTYKSHLQLTLASMKCTSSHTIHPTTPAALHGLQQRIGQMLNRTLSQLLQAVRVVSTRVMSDLQAPCYVARDVSWSVGRTEINI